MSKQTLNKAQLEAVFNTGGPLMVVAGPGTGKTHMLTSRLAYLLQEIKVAPSHILAVTFTRGAAQEMSERLLGLLGATVDVQVMTISTFHALCLAFLQENNFPFGPGIAFSVADEEKRKDLLEGLLPARERGKFLDELSLAKQQLREPGDALSRQYQSRLLENKLLDFDDLFIYTLRLFKENPVLLKRHRERFRYVMVDEFQDTSFAQYALLQLLCPAGAHVCVVGDPDQAIYNFSGSGFDPFAAFRQDYPEHKTIVLGENYRSQSVIFKAARQVIDKNETFLPRQARALLEGGLPIEILAAQSAAHEAQMIVQKIQALLGAASFYALDSHWAKGDDEAGLYGLRDIVIFYRFNAQAHVLKSALSKAGLPYEIFGPLPKSDGELEDREHQPAQAEAGRRPKAEKISLMSLHRSKGLEFPIVVIAGLEEGLVPFFGFSGEDRKSERRLAEERRLFYVGLTRAKRRLFLCYAKKRFLLGRHFESGPSPFLQDIEAELKKIEAQNAAAGKRPRKKDPSEPSLF